MRLSQVVAGLLLALALALVASAPASAADPSALASAKRCRPVTIAGGIRASVSAQRVPCRNARRLVLRWERRVNSGNCDRSNGFCRVVRVRGYRCVRGGGELVVRLTCSRRVSGRLKRVRAAWGD